MFSNRFGLKVRQLRQAECPRAQGGDCHQNGSTVLTERSKPTNDNTTLPPQHFTSTSTHPVPQITHCRITLLYVPHINHCIPFNKPFIITLCQNRSSSTVFMCYSTATFITVLISLYWRTYVQYSRSLPQSNQSAGPVRFLIFCSRSIFLLASLVAGRRHQYNAGAVQQGMYSTIPIYWNIKSAPASPGRSRVGPAFYVSSFLGHSILSGTAHTKTRITHHSAYLACPPIQFHTFHTPLFLVTINQEH